MSRGTSEAFFDVVEWAASQSWSSGKVGLLGISYYAGSQWRVAARQPKGLACIVPWEGMSDYYRDRCRHGGILSNTFIKFWWNRQVSDNTTISSVPLGSNLRSRLSQTNTADQVEPLLDGVKTPSKEICPRRNYSPIAKIKTETMPLINFSTKTTMPQGNMIWATFKCLFYQLQTGEAFYCTCVAM